MEKERLKEAILIMQETQQGFNQCKGSPEYLFVLKKGLDYISDFLMSLDTENQTKEVEK